MLPVTDTIEAGRPPRSAVISDSIIDKIISELKRFEREGDMPRLQVLRISNDHTSGTTAGKVAPLAAVADNDLHVALQGRRRYDGASKFPILTDPAGRSPAEEYF